MSEQVIKWEPIDGLSEKYALDLFEDNIQAFKLKLSTNKCKEKRVLVTFENSANNHRFSRTDVWSRSSMNSFENQSVYQHWTFFKVVNSNYLRWFSNNTYEINPSAWDQHFCFIMSNFVIDVIHHNDPLVEIIKE